MPMLKQTSLRSKGKILQRARLQKDLSMYNLYKGGLSSARVFEGIQTNGMRVAESRFHALLSVNDSCWKIALLYATEIRASNSHLSLKMSCS